MHCHKIALVLEVTDAMADDTLVLVSLGPPLADQNHRVLKSKKNDLRSKQMITYAFIVLLEGLLPFMLMKR